MAVSYELQWHGEIVGHELHDLFGEGLNDALEHLLGVSTDLVPLDEGPLMHSGVVSVDDHELRGCVSYDTVYAVYQHEKLELRHAPGRTAKYLEGPFHAERPVMLELIAAPAQTRLAT